MDDKSIKKNDTDSTLGMSLEEEVLQNQYPGASLPGITHSKELDARIAQVHVQMEQAATPEVLYRLQGQAHALRRLKTLRDQVNG